MISTAFIPHLAATYLSRKAGQPQSVADNFEILEERWLSIYGVGKLELYRYLYSECRHADDFMAWLLQLKGAEALSEAHANFDEWVSRDPCNTSSAVVNPTLLNAAELQHWNNYGFLKIGGLVPEQLCDAVKQFICDYQGIDLSDRTTWYPSHEDWHGLMLQVYQHPSIEAIRMHHNVKQLFAELYQTHDIVANTDKVSYNPPETDTWTFRHHHLHWDIDMSQPAAYYIQGLIYLDDVPENRGALKVVPGFHKQYEAYVAQFEHTDQAQQSIRDLAAAPVPGKKGDIVLWQQTLPHAASTNHSELPRFVQYLSFTKL